MSYLDNVDTIRKLFDSSELDETFGDFPSEGSLRYYAWLHKKGIDPLIHQFWSPDALRVERAKEYIAQAEKKNEDK
jgi:hypothetical protein